MFIATVILLAFSTVHADGGLDINLGYRYIDDEGNQSVNQSTYNYYDGFGVSIQNINYAFANGILLRSNLNNINLDNRNLYFNISKPGLFGVKARSNRYRRIYNYDGDNNTKRDLTSADIWMHPIKHIKLFAGSDFDNVTGKTEDMFGSSFGDIARDVDYDRQKFNFGGLVKYEGRMFRGEYGTSNYNDNEQSGNDQTRELIRLIALTPMPEFDWITLSGSYQKFTTEYDDTEFKLESTTYKGSIFAELPNNFTINYIAYFNRAGSDSDFVETDNLSHSIYVKYSHSSKLGAVIGYQNHINDDYEDAIKTNAMFIECWGSPTDKLSLKAAYGFCAEKVDEGARLLGDEDRSRYKLSANYRFDTKSSLKAQLESKKRKNDQLGSESDYIRLTFEGAHDLPRYAMISAGYSYSDGEYTNTEQKFKYTNHQFHAGINTYQYKKLSCKAMVIYYKSQDDLDIEGSDISLTGTYNIKGGDRIEFTYNVYNFDDFQHWDRYYTANTVEVNIIKSLNF